MLNNVSHVEGGSDKEGNEDSDRDVILFDEGTGVTGELANFLFFEAVSSLSLTLC